MNKLVAVKANHIGTKEETNLINKWLFVRQMSYSSYLTETTTDYSTGSEQRGKGAHGEEKY